MTPRPDDEGSAGTQPPPPHGFHLSPADERLLRGPPPPQALRWAAAALGAGARVREVRALEGGTSSAVHALSIEDARGQAYSLVLRRFVRLDWLADEPDLAEREATALGSSATLACPPRSLSRSIRGASPSAFRRCS